MTGKKKKVFVGMSGGVDSSVAAALLKKKGYNVIGVHLKCYNADGCASEDAEDARRAAETLAIPFYVFDFETEYEKRVIEYMVDGYKKGITPNPDVMCNKEIKFGLFFEKARGLGADYIATGHYVKKVRKNGQNFLAIAKDKNKDQSYFLWTLTKNQIDHSLFPLGDYLKDEVRKLAKKFNLHNADKKDSQGICFLGRVNLKDFLKKYIPEKRGVVINSAGEIVGKHEGAYFYTIGQRHGLNLGTRKKGEAPAPRYVIKKDIKKNIVTIASGRDNEKLYQREINLMDIYFTDGKRHETPLAIMARIRYRQSVAAAKLLPSNSRGSRNKRKLVFRKPQKFVAIGQSAVFYNTRGVLLGGGIIG